MVGEYTQARRLKTLVEHYVDVRRRKHQFICIALAIRAIPQFETDPISDNFLAQMIAEYARDQGLDVRIEEAGSAISLEAA
ncbi:MAG: hypothetical protein EOS78_02490 [Mesorhizobium sp.]|nr:MAG: hypothetical protein EOS78_02490 [Mesorhizobium sp.]